MHGSEIEPGGRWLLLIHQLPPKPTGLRVKVWRRLQALGAIAIKNSVYVLPRSERTREDFEWVVRAVVKDGGEASLCEGSFVDGLSDPQVEALFTAARDADYRIVADAARDIGKALAARRTLTPARRAELLGRAARLRRRLSEIAAIDFFGGSGRVVAEGLLTGLEPRLGLGAAATPEPRGLQPEAFRARTWVTRRGVHIDRMASAWLIQRWVDPQARFKFVSGRGYQPQAEEVRFDMFEAEFTHDGDLCTFEVLCARFGLRDGALRAIGEIVHDIDLKDAKFGRPEAIGIDRLIAGVAMSHRDDDARLERGAAIFSDLYEYFRRKRG